MSIQEYLGPKIFNDIRANAIKDAAVFVSQSLATKAQLADSLKVENSMHKQSTAHLVNVIDDVAAENELLEKKNKYYQDIYGNINKDYIEKGELVVIRTIEKIHAKKALMKYIQKYEAEHQSDSNQHDQKKSIPLNKKDNL